jgi:hypothetical protein
MVTSNIECEKLLAIMFQNISSQQQTHEHSLKPKGKAKPKPK